MNVLGIGAGVAAVTAAHHLLEHGPVFDKDRINISSGTNSSAQRATVGSGYWFFTGSIDIEHQEHIDFRQYLREVLIQVTGTGIAMRLVNHHKPFIRPATADGFNRCRDFRWVMTIIIDQLA